VDDATEGKTGDRTPAAGKGAVEGPGKPPPPPNDWEDREDELELQLAMADQELAAMRRKLAEARSENDDLLKAVAYLRSKLESNQDSRRAGTPAVSQLGGRAPADGAASIEVCLYCWNSCFYTRHVARMYAALQTERQKYSSIFGSLFSCL
jgi:uncharacterized coiled-coil protein SlyX